MTEAIQKYEPEMWIELAYKLLTKNCEEEEGLDVRPATTLQWLQEQGIEREDALKLICSQEFTKFLHNMSVAITKADFDAEAYRRMMEIVRIGKDKDAIAAVKLLADLLGYAERSPLVSINIEQAVDRISGGEIIEIMPGM